jgi:signal transduction histidine kinase
MAHQEVPAEIAAKTGDAVFRTLQRPVRETDLMQTVRQALSLLSQRRVAAGPAGAANADYQDLARRADQLADLNRLKDELLMVAAHDIRAPLSVILGYCDIVQNNEPGMSESGKEILGRIQLSANRLLTLVNNVLNIAAMEEGRLELKLAPTRVSAIVTDVIDSLAGLAQERQMEFRVEIAGDDRSYELDAIKVSQILQNLLSNAIKFNEPGGIVHIRVRAAEDKISFEVRDSGRGMTPDQAAQAFHKFARFASGSTTGSGLGLAIAKGLSELHGGMISVETRLNEGSRFQFTVKPGHQGSTTRPLLH